MNGKVLGAAFLGFVALKAASRHHAMGGGFGPREPGMVGRFGPSGRRGPGGRHGRHLDANDPRRQWIREFHRSLHEDDEAEAAGATAGTAGDAAPTSNPASAD